MNSFLQGLSYNVRGIQYFFSQKSLWKFVLIPLALNSLALVLLVVLYFAYVGELFSFISGLPGSLDIAEPANVLWHILDGLLWFARGILKLLFVLLSLVIIFVAVFLMSSLVNSPFYEAMAEKILILKGGREDKPFVFKNFLGETGHSLKIEAFKVGFFLAVSLGLLFLSFIPVLGFVFSLFGFVFAAWFFAFGLATFPMVLNRRKFSQMLGWGLQNKMALVGFGLPSLIPVLGVILASFQVVGGTLLYIDLKTD